MTSRVGLAALVALALTVVCISNALTAEGQKGEVQPKVFDPKAVDPKAMEQMMAELAKVGPEHERFQYLVGTWKTQCKVFCKDPKNPEVSEGTALFKLLLGGRFVEQHFHGTFEGKPFEGLGLCGYDNAKKKYTSIWADTMGTGLMHMVGDFNEADKAMTEIGQSETPAGLMRVKIVTKHVDDNNFLFTMYMLLPDGSENKTMEIHYTRQ